MGAAHRNRIARDQRGTRPTSTRVLPLDQQRPSHITHDPDIRPNGYVGSQPRVRYAGSGDQGYQSAWAASPYFTNAVTVDPRWSGSLAPAPRLR